MKNTNKLKNLSNRGKAHKRPLIAFRDEDVHYIGKPTYVHSIYDFVNINDDWQPIISRYGTFSVRDHDEDGNPKVDEQGNPVYKAIDQWKPVKQDDMGDSATLRYQSSKLDPRFLIHFPEYHEAPRYAKLSTLFLKIRSGIEQHVKLENYDFVNAVATWALATHFHRVFDHFPILDLVKVGYDAGGSVALKTVLTYTSRPCILQSPTEAALFRLADDLRPTIGIEEFTSNMDEKVRKAITQLLDGSFDKDIFIPRTDKKDEVGGFDFYGPRALVDPHGMLGQYSTASRALVVPLVNAHGFQSDSTHLAVEENKLVQTLYDSFLFYAEDVRVAYQNCKIEGSGRMDQAFRPLIAMALVLRREGIEIVDSLMRLVKSQYENLQVVKTEGDITKQILAAIRDFVVNETENRKWYRESDRTVYVRVINLRNALTNMLGIEFQSDTSKGDTRYWKRPTKDMAEILQDTKRFAALLRTFLPDYVGQAEPSSRNLCLFYNVGKDNNAPKLVERLSKLIGDEPKHSYNILPVGLHVDPVFSSVINKINNKFLHTKTYKKDHEGIRLEDRDMKVYFFFSRNCRNDFSCRIGILRARIQILQVSYKRGCRNEDH